MTTLIRKIDIPTLRDIVNWNRDGLVKTIRDKFYDLKIYKQYIDGVYYFKFVLTAVFPIKVDFVTVAKTKATAYYSSADETECVFKVSLSEDEYHALSIEHCYSYSFRREFELFFVRFHIRFDTFQLSRFEEKCRKAYDDVYRRVSNALWENRKKREQELEAERQRQILIREAEDASYRRSRVINNLIISNKDIQIEKIKLLDAKEMLPFSYISGYDEFLISISSKSALSSINLLVDKKVKSYKNTAFFVVKQDNDYNKPTPVVNFPTDKRRKGGRYNYEVILAVYKYYDSFIKFNFELLKDTIDSPKYTFDSIFACSTHGYYANKEFKEYGAITRIRSINYTYYDIPEEIGTASYGCIRVDKNSDKVLYILDINLTNKDYYIDKVFFNGKIEEKNIKGGELYLDRVGKLKENKWRVVFRKKYVGLKSA